MTLCNEVPGQPKGCFGPPASSLCGSPAPLGRSRFALARPSTSTLDRLSWMYFRRSETQPLVDHHRKHQLQTVGFLFLAGSNPPLLHSTASHDAPQRVCAGQDTGRG